MEIRKLGELCEIVIGKTPRTNIEQYWNQNDVPFIDGSLRKKGRYISNFAIKSNKQVVADKSDILMSILGNFDFVYVDECTAFNQQVCLIKNNSNEKIFSKYLYFFLKKSIKRFETISIGTTVKHLNKTIIKNFEISFPKISIQQQIINIIEPFEKIKKNILSKLEQLKNLYSKIINNKFNYELMINNEIKFEKGVNFKKIKFSSNGITFINVSAINNKPNKYVDLISKNLINVNYGDVVISLDGTPGLVNNFLYGINGYGYKLVSSKYKNYELYFSLLNKYNQKVISKFSTGTTILHASKAKNELVIMDFEKYKNVLEKIYEIEIKWKAINLNLYRIINNLIFKYLV